MTNGFVHVLQLLNLVPQGPTGSRDSVLHAYVAPVIGRLGVVFSHSTPAITVLQRANQLVRPPLEVDPAEAAQSLRRARSKKQKKELRNCPRLLSSEEEMALFGRDAALVLVESLVCKLDVTYGSASSKPVLTGDWAAKPVKMILIDMVFARTSTFLMCR